MSVNTETDKKSVAARLVSMAQERYLLGVSDEGEPFGAALDAVVAKQLRHPA